MIIDLLARSSRRAINKFGKSKRKFKRFCFNFLRDTIFGITWWEKIKGDLFNYYYGLWSLSRKWLSLLIVTKWRISRNSKKINHRYIFIAAYFTVNKLSLVINHKRILPERWREMFYILISRVTQAQSNVTSNNYNQRTGLLWIVKMHHANPRQRLLPNTNSTF